MKDYARYPRTPDTDINGLPAKVVMPCCCPRGGNVSVWNDGLRTNARARITNFMRHAPPGHFTVWRKWSRACSIWFRPDGPFRAQDYQQLQVIRYMATEMSFPTRVIAAPTLREADGLAMSSRNQYLDSEQRHTATFIYQTLNFMKDQAALGMPIHGIEAEAKQRLEMMGFVVDYAEIRRSDLSRALIE